MVFFYGDGKNLAIISRMIRVIILVCDPIVFAHPFKSQWYKDKDFWQVLFLVSRLILVALTEECINGVAPLMFLTVPWEGENFYPLSTSFLPFLLWIVIINKEVVKPTTTNQDKVTTITLENKDLDSTPPIFLWASRASLSVWQTCSGSQTTSLIGINCCDGKQKCLTSPWSSIAKQDPLLHSSDGQSETQILAKISKLRSSWGSWVWFKQIFTSSSKHSISW